MVFLTAQEKPQHRTCIQREWTTGEGQQSMMNCFSPVNKAAARRGETLQSSNISHLFKHLGTTHPAIYKKPKDALASKSTPGIQKESQLEFLKQCSTLQLLVTAAAKGIMKARLWI